MKDFVLADDWVFTVSSESGMPEKDRLEKILNNSFGLSESQFGMLHSIATGKVDTSAAEINIPTPTFPDCHFVFQGAQKSRDKSAQPFRDHLIATCFNLATQKMTRVFVRAKQNNPAALKKLLRYHRPSQFIRDLLERLEAGAQITTLVRHVIKPAPKPAPAHKQQQPKQTQQPGQRPQQPRPPKPQQPQNKPQQQQHQKKPEHKPAPTAPAPKPEPPKRSANAGPVATLADRWPKATLARENE